MRSTPGTATGRALSTCCVDIVDRGCYCALTPVQEGGRRNGCLGSRRVVACRLFCAYGHCRLEESPSRGVYIRHQPVSRLVAHWLGRGTGNVRKRLPAATNLAWPYAELPLRLVAVAANAPFSR